MSRHRWSHDLQAKTGVCLKCGCIYAWEEREPSAAFAKSALYRNLYRPGEKVRDMVYTAKGAGHSSKRLPPCLDS